MVFIVNIGKTNSYDLTSTSSCLLHSQQAKIICTSVKETRTSQFIDAKVCRCIFKTIRQIVYLHYFSVTAACFLGFNLKKRPIAARLAYVAKTHYKGSSNSLNKWIDSIVSLVTVDLHFSYQPWCMRWSTWQNQRTGAGILRHDLPWWISEPISGWRGNKFYHSWMWHSDTSSVWLVSKLHS